MKSKEEVIKMEIEKPSVIILSSPEDDIVYREPDRLEHMYDLQKILQNRMIATKYKDVPKQTVTNTMFLALVAETMELLEETAWKPWKEQVLFTKPPCLKELADVMHFFLAVMIQLNITPEELFNEYIKKNEENHKRQNEGY